MLVKCIRGIIVHHTDPVVLEYVDFDGRQISAMLSRRFLMVSTPTPAYLASSCFDSSWFVLFSLWPSGPWMRNGDEAYLAYSGRASELSATLTSVWMSWMRASARCQLAGRERRQLQRPPLLQILVCLSLSTCGRGLLLLKRCCFSLLPNFPEIPTETPSLPPNSLQPSKHTHPSRRSPAPAGCNPG